MVEGKKLFHKELYVDRWTKDYFMEKHELLKDFVRKENALKLKSPTQKKSAISSEEKENFPTCQKLSQELLPPEMQNILQPKSVLSQTNNQNFLEQENRKPSQQ